MREQDFNLAKKNFPDSFRQKTIKKKSSKRNFYIFLVFVLIGVFGYIIFFENSEVETIPENTSSIALLDIEEHVATEVNSKEIDPDRDVLYRDNLANPRLSIRNATDDEVIGLDHDGTVAAINFEADQNVNATGNMTAGYGLFTYLGDLVNQITKGWFTDVVSGGINATGNMTVEGIRLEANQTGHFIYNNATCIIIEGSTSTLYIC